MPGHLVITTEDGATLEVRVSGEPISIGRAPDSTIRSDDRRTSRRHVEVRRLSDGGYEIEDLGSSYGTTLNGRAITRERLNHLDLIGCGGLRAQFYLDPEVPMPEGAAEDLSQHASELRAQIHKLIEENAAVRGDLGKAREAQTLSERRHEEAHDEAARLREVVAELRREGDEAKARIETLGQELRNARGSASARQAVEGEEAAEKAAQKEAQRQIERLRERAVELEQQQGQWALREQALKKEVERLGEMAQKLQQREADLQKAMKPALMRIAQLQDELEKARIKLAQTEGDLADLRKR